MIKCTHIDKEYVGQDFLNMYCKTCDHMDETRVTATTITCPHLKEFRKTKKGKETEVGPAGIPRRT